MAGTSLRVQEVKPVCWVAGGRDGVPEHTAPGFRPAGTNTQIVYGFTKETTESKD